MNKRQLRKIFRVFNFQSSNFLQHPIFWAAYYLDSGNQKNRWKLVSTKIASQENCPLFNLLVPPCIFASHCFCLHIRMMQLLVKSIATNVKCFFGWCKTLQKLYCKKKRSNFNARQKNKEKKVMAKYRCMRCPETCLTIIHYELRYQTQRASYFYFWCYIQYFSAII